MFYTHVTQGTTRVMDNHQVSCDTWQCFLPRSLSPSLMQQDSKLKNKINRALAKASIPRFYFDLFYMLDKGWPSWTKPLLRWLIPLSNNQLSASTHSATNPICAGTTTLWWVVVVSSICIDCNYTCKTVNIFSVNWLIPLHKPLTLMCFIYCVQQTPSAEWVPQHVQVIISLLFKHLALSESPNMYRSSSACCLNT